MPYSDPEKRRQNSKKWRTKKIQEGYGKAIYARRAARYRNEEILRAAVEEILDNAPNNEHWEWLTRTCKKALKDAPPVKPTIDYMPS